MYTGLKEGDDPSGSFPGRLDPSFCAWCDAFLNEQLPVMRPRLVVALGRPVRRRLECSAGSVLQVSRGGIDYAMVGLVHPSAPTYHRRLGDMQLIDREAAFLKAAFTAVE